MEISMMSYTWISQKLLTRWILYTRYPIVARALVHYVQPLGRVRRASKGILHTKVDHDILLQKLLKELSFTSEWLEYNTPSGQVILPSKIVKDLGVYLSAKQRYRLVSSSR